MKPITVGTYTIRSCIKNKKEIFTVWKDKKIIKTFDRLLHATTYAIRSSKCSS